MRLGPVELTIIFLIVIVLFGAGRISGIGSELGEAIKNFRTGLRSDEEETADKQEKEAEKS